MNNIINQWNQKMWMKMTCKYVPLKYTKENQSENGKSYKKWIQKKNINNHCKTQI
jgi:hypothetical protein